MDHSKYSQLLSFVQFVNSESRSFRLNITYSHIPNHYLLPEYIFQSQSCHLLGEDQTKKINNLILLYIRLE